MGGLQGDKTGENQDKHPRHFEILQHKPVLAPLLPPTHKSWSASPVMQMATSVSTTPPPSTNNSTANPTAHRNAPRLQPHQRQAPFHQLRLHGQANGCRDRCAHSDPCPLRYQRGCRQVQGGARVWGVGGEGVLHTVRLLGQGERDCKREGDMADKQLRAPCVLRHEVREGCDQREGQREEGKKKWRSGGVDEGLHRNARSSMHARQCTLVPSPVA